MDPLEFSTDTDVPGGLLVLAANGRIVEAPVFFRRALFLSQRDITESIFHLFDPSETPHLKLNRIFRHPYGGTEYHLRVQGLFGNRHGFRYWPVEVPDDQLPPGAVAYYLVDDSALLQNHDWDVRRLRRKIMDDVQDSMSSYFKNRLATLRLLTETIRDAPEMAETSAPRLVGAVEELQSALNRVITGIEDIESPTDYQDSPVRIADLAGVINTWGTPEVEVECRMTEVAASTMIPASSIERILLPVVENAIDASPREEEVVVEIKQLDEGFAHFEVVDQGDGMNERVQRRAEDPFFSTRTGQLGLGLAHARDALREAGGEWNIESRANQGTRVVLLLPTTTAEEFFG